MTFEPVPPVGEPVARLVTMAEAAAYFAVTSDAIRHRLRRGGLKGKQVGGRWYVEIPADIPPASAANQTTPDAHQTKPDAAGATRPDDEQTKPDVGQPEPDANTAALIERLEQENDWLRRRLEDADAERERIRLAMEDERREQRRLLLNEQQRLAEAHAQLARLLPPPAETPDTPDAAPDASSPRPASSGQVTQRPPAPGLVERVRRFLYGERRR